jgi:uncharacterized protein (TIGR00299 family) protein
VIAYLDCVGGIAGDMLIAALLDAGAAEEGLHELPRRLGIDGVELRPERVKRHGIGALRVEVRSSPEHDGPRSWRSLREQLAAAELPQRARERSLAVFARLARAEGAVHEVAADEVHFHELGAVDTLLDVVGAVTLLEELGVTRLVCSPLPVARGVIQAAHGSLPLPAPATVQMLLDAPVFGVDMDGELVTPTGAALASTLADGWGPMPAMTLRRVG